MDQALLDDIKFDCDVSDARYWGYYSICGLLMRYRDLYRSELGLKAWSEINRTDIAAWIERKEKRWPDLEQQQLKDIRIGDAAFDPFDVTGINKLLKEQGLVYGAGYAMYMKPTFFLAELKSAREVAGLTVYTAGRELVRDLFTAPAMLQERTIFLRLEPLVMLMLYKHAELGSRPASPLADAFTAYGFPNRQLIDSTFEQRMENAAERFADILLQHEIAEHAEGSAEWKDLLAAASGDRRVEHFLRAVKDLLADTSDAGPFRKIVEEQDRGGLGLFIALADGYRKVLFPEMREAYRRFTEQGEWSLIEQARKDGYRRFRLQRDAIVGLFRRSPEQGAFIEAMKELAGRSGKSSD